MLLIKLEYAIEDSNDYHRNKFIGIWEILLELRKKQVIDQSLWSRHKTSTNPTTFLFIHFHHMAVIIMNLQITFKKSIILTKFFSYCCKRSLRW